MREKPPTSSPTRSICMHLRYTVRVDQRVLREATALAKAGFAVTVVDVENDLSRPVEEDIEGVHVKHLMKPHWFTIPNNRLQKVLLTGEKFICSLISLIQVPAEVYHAHDLSAFPPCYITAVICRKQLIFDAHELPLSSELPAPWKQLRWIFQGLLTLALSRCSGTITVSPPIGQELSRRYHAPAVSIIRNLPAHQVVTKSDQLRQHLALGQETRIVLYQGDIQTCRSLDKLIYAAKFLKPGTVLVMMGRAYDDIQEQFEKLIEHVGVQDRVKILPPVPYKDLLHWTSSADIGLIIYPPDYSLNFRWCLPNKLFEYIMAGLPVLASSLDAVAEILDQYSVGRIVPSQSPQDIAITIEAILADHKALDQMHNNALVAREKLCWEQEQHKLIRFYQNILVPQRAHGITSNYVQPIYQYVIEKARARMSEAIALLDRTSKLTR